MAHPIIKPEIRRMPLLPYTTLRDDLRSGDLIFCSGSYVFSGLIQRFTGSVWSHVGIIYRDEHLGRVFILESETGIGVRLVPLSKYLLDYHGRRRPYRGEIVIGRVDPNLDTEQVRKAVSYGMDLLTRPYDNGEILRIAARIAFRVGAPHAGPQVHLLGVGRRVLPCRRPALQPTGQLHQPRRYLAQ